VKIGTWNVNGIRARQTEVLRWIDREEPDVICLQETKASPEHVPEPLAQVAGYHAHWHGHKGYSGVALLLRTARYGDAPAFVHPHFDLEHRIVVAAIGDLVLGSVYVPNGGKDLPAKMTFLRELVAWAGAQQDEGKHLVLCGDFNVARTDIDVHPMLRKSMIGQSGDERALIEALFGYGLVDVAPPRRPRQRSAVHLVGAVEQPAPAQHRLAARLHRRRPGAGRRDRALRHLPRRRHQRSRAGDRPPPRYAARGTRASAHPRAVIHSRPRPARSVTRSRGSP